MTTPRGPLIVVPTELPPSVVRTVVPYIAGALIVALAKAGWNSDDKIPYAAAQVVVSALYYTLVRFLEIHHSEKWGWLLGLAKAPAYSPAPPPQAAPDVVLAPPSDTPSP